MDGCEGGCWQLESTKDTLLCLFYDTEPGIWCIKGAILYWMTFKREYLKAITSILTLISQCHSLLYSMNKKYYYREMKGYTNFCIVSSCSNMAYGTCAFVSKLLGKVRSYRVTHKVKNYVYPTFVNLKLLFLCYKPINFVL